MADELSFGSVPPYYREVYDIVCPEQDRIDRDLFVKILIKSSLPKQTLSTIWDAVDSKQGYISRGGLYKALALTALAQQGKTPNVKLLENFSGQELPKPSLGDLTDLKTLSQQFRRERAPNILNYNYEELCAMDEVKVELIPEKKGLLLKHVEYEVTSRMYKTTVFRRYSDFAAVSEMLINCYPYRMVPRLPPKKMIGANREFIEQRRRALVRFLTLVVRHPTFHRSEIVRYFLTFTGSDMQHRIKEQFRGIPDEFVTSKLAAQAKDLVPMDTQIQFGNSKEQIKNLFYSMSLVKGYVDQMSLRAAGNASDMLAFAKELSSLGGESQPASAWAMGHNDSWPNIKTGLKSVAVEFAALSEKCMTQGRRLADDVSEKFWLFLDLLQAYKDLCERHEKGVLRDHQNALQKMAAIKKKKMSATIRGGEYVSEVEQLESRIIEQESQIMTMENRNFFSLHCLQMETQLIHANIPLIANVMQTFAEAEVNSHKELHQVWQDNLEKVLKHMSPSSSNSSSTAATL
ncbi:sorting nexin-8-like isoform X1 [Diadema setosum]|uniref:sorting nexin-8-like isoform X1 n=1 Tax=Diadema setosum TaxID=31175 RepID=UPI003B3A5E86